MNIHDYRTTYWGHNHYMEQESDGTYKGFCFDSKRFRVGDEILWNTSYGTVFLTVTHVKPCMDPHDMYMVHAKTSKRQVKKSFIDKNGTPPFEYEVI